MKTRYSIECGKFGIYVYDTVKETEMTLQDVVAILNDVTGINLCPECGNKHGEGAAEWCYSCCLHNGLIGR